MKKLLSIACLLGSFSISPLNAQPLPDLSGIYQNLILGVDLTQNVVTGYYKETYEPPNLPHLECSFYLFGKKKNGSYEIQAWSPGEKRAKSVAGELSFFSNGGSKPSALLKLGESLNRDCTALKPNLTKGQGVFFDIKNSGSWKEVRIVANPKSPYYQAPDLSSPTRDSAKRGTVLTVVERRGEWAQVQSDQKPKGWIKESDLYPTSPSAMPEPAIAGKSMPLAQTTEISAPPASQPTPNLETKDSLVEDLKAISSQAFELALQALKNPSKRNALAVKRVEMEKNLDALVSRLNVVAPSGYAEASKEIFEAFLDLRYVERETPVVSLRLNKVIQAFGKQK